MINHCTNKNKKQCLFCNLLNRNIPSKLSDNDQKHSIIINANNFKQTTAI